MKRSVKYTAELGTILSSNRETPFWLRANQYGIVPLTSPIVTLKGSVSSDYKTATLKEDQYKFSKFDWGYGLNVVGNVGKENQILIPEAYIKAKYGAFEIYGGRRKEIFGLVDSTLSSGSYIWSGNALPMPKIQISNPDFVPLGFTKGFLSFKGSYAHGWFENSRTDVKNFYLHQKSLYFRLGKPNWKFHFYGGFNHQVQWGGELLFSDPNNIISKGGKLPSSFNDYISVVTGKSLAVESDTSRFSKYDAGNRSGNHLGTIDFGLNIRINSVNVLLYRQNVYEDGSLYYLSNIADGLNGVSISKTKNNKKISINKVTIEFLKTTSQGGDVSPETTNARLRGRDNYFNNGQYLDGWAYLNKGLGSAFIQPFSEIVNTPKLDGLFFSNNRVNVYYLGLYGSFDEIQVESRISYSENLGLYDMPFKNNQNQYSFLLKVNSPVKNLKHFFVKTYLAYDNGSIFNNGVGMGLGIYKTW